MVVRFRVWQAGGPPLILVLTNIANLAFLVFISRIEQVVEIARGPIIPVRNWNVTGAIRRIVRNRACPISGGICHCLLTEFCTGSSALGVNVGCNRKRHGGVVHHWAVVHYVALRSVRIEVGDVT